ncbi:tetraspanin-8-like [Trematomus bernacchii]|uniref:tetraspanin-8-like n=1 Tax=Trematomus bernacchii TaxID=40690 RepID=UPI00146A01C0|nr:tetraspanin-8-like [Trematomus bernacchii]
MAHVNICVKRLLTIFNIFFAIIGGLIIAFAFIGQTLSNSHGGGNIEGRGIGLIGLYLFGSVTMVIAVLGAYGSHKESKGCLIAFLVCMVIGSLIMLRGGIPIATVRPMLGDILEEKLRMAVPLDTASSEDRVMVESIQHELQCCGLFSYRDWEDSIPDTCLCNGDEEMEGICKTVDTAHQEPKEIYEKACFPIVRQYFLLIADIAIGVCFTLAVLALLGLALSSVMIHQIRHGVRAPMMMTIPAIFSAMPPKYEELKSPPEY